MGSVVVSWLRHWLGGMVAPEVATHYEGSQQSRVTLWAQSE